MEKLLIVWVTWVIALQCFAQNLPSPVLHHFKAPEDTRITLNFPADSPDTLRLSLLHLEFSMMPNRLDTTLPAGIRQFTTTLPLDHAHLVRIRINDIPDKLFAIPGKTIDVFYDTIQLKAIKKRVANNETLNNINDYYDAFYRSIGYPQDIRDVYSQYGTLPTLERVAETFLQLEKEQIKLLENYQHSLPEWFFNYEIRNIRFTSLSYIYSAASYRAQILNITEDIPPQYYEQWNHVDINDEQAIPTAFFYNFLQSLALRQFCSNACFDGSDQARKRVHKAMVSFAETIKSDAVRDYFLAVNIFLLYRGSRNVTSEIEDLFLEKLSPAYRTRLASVKADIIALNGKTAPNFYLKDLNGDFHTMKDFRGKVVLLNFWFVGCKPCIEEIPHEKQLTASLANKGFVLLNICTNSAEEQWRSTVEKYQMPGMNLYAQGNWTKKLSASYQITGYPRYILIGQDGKIIDDKCERPSHPQLEENILKHLH